MAKGKRTYVGFYSVETGNLVHVTNIQKRNFEAAPSLSLHSSTPFDLKGRFFYVLLYTFLFEKEGDWVCEVGWNRVYLFIIFLNQSLSQNKYSRS